MFQNINDKLRAVAKRIRSHLPAERKALKRDTQSIKDEIKALKFVFFKNSPSKIFSFAFEIGGGGNPPQSKIIHFHLPTFDNDAIQSAIFSSSTFYDIHTIKQADKYFKDGANILDIGANIGNNAVYYAMIRNANKIYAFEPIKDTFEILRKNIELNSL